MPLRVAVAVAASLFLAGASARPQAAPPATKPAAAFGDVVRRAEAERAAGHLAEAERLYRQALDERPGWVEGWLFLGTMAYERDRHAECRDAFRRFLALQPKSGPAWAFRGLCEFGLGDYEGAGRSIDEALSLGGLRDEALLSVVLYHLAVLRIRSSAFEKALPALTQLATARPETPELVQACGLVLLRRPQLPADVPAGDRERVRRAGEAYCAYLARRASEARSRYEQLLRDYPGQEHLHYGYGLLLAQQGDPGAATQFRREIETHPGHVLAWMELAFELLKRGEAKAAVPAAQEAVRLAPTVFAAHLALGRALVETGDLPRGIAALEEAAHLGPGIRETLWALQTAYTRAGRTADAERARTALRALDAARRAPGGAEAPETP